MLGEVILCPLASIWFSDSGLLMTLIILGMTHVMTCRPPWAWIIWHFFFLILVAVRLWGEGIDTTEWSSNFLTSCQGYVPLQSFIFDDQALKTLLWSTERLRDVLTALAGADTVSRALLVWKLLYPTSLLTNCAYEVIATQNWGGWELERT